jgi:hypothetical protein
MIEDVLVVDASAHSYNLAKDNYAAGRYSRVDAFHGAHHGLEAAMSVRGSLTRFANRADPFAAAFFVPYVFWSAFLQRRFLRP